MLIGVLALQGGFAAHARILRDLGADVREVRTVADLDGLDGLVMPGGESTTMTHGDDVEVLAEVDGHPVAVRQGNVLAVSFHPELSGETALHERFLEAVRRW